MHTLSGIISSEKLDEGSDLRYNGYHADKLGMQLHKLIGYVPQEDVHLPQLTVKETLEFARKSSFTVSDSQLSCPLR